MEENLVQRIKSDPDYHRLVSTRSKYSWTLAVFMLIVYYGYVLLVAFNKDFLAWVDAAMKSGKSVDAAAAEYAIPPSYRGYTPNPDQTKLNIGVIYNELKK